MPIEDMVDIEGFDADVAGELRERARAFLAERDEEFSRKRRELCITDDLTNVAGISAAMLVALGENGVKTLDDLADLASDELIEIVPPGTLGEDKANEIIMAARAHWFEGEDEEGDGKEGRKEFSEYRYRTTTGSNIS